MKPLVELHTHILPNIDDGPQDLASALLMVKSYANSGVTTVVATPHFYVDRLSEVEFLLKRNLSFEMLEKEIEKQEVPVRLIKGAEVFFSSQLLDLELDKLVIEGTNYMLLEFTPSFTPVFLKQQIFSITSQGIIPILAHIERYKFLMDDYKEIIKLINLGVLMSINTSTVLNKSKRRLVKRLFDGNYIHLIASDAHDIEKRPPNLVLAYQYIEKHYSKDLSEYLQDNAEMIINNQKIDKKEPKLKRSFFKF